MVLVKEIAQAAIGLDFSFSDFAIVCAGPRCTKKCFLHRVLD